MHKIAHRVWASPNEHGSTTAAEMLGQFDTESEAKQLRRRLESLGVDAWIEEITTDFDENYAAVQLMGSSMGDLEILDIVETQSDGIRRRRHVLRTRARDGNLPGAPLAEMLYTQQFAPEGDYRWYLTGAGMDYILENCGPREAVAQALRTKIPVVAS